MDCVWNVCIVPIKMDEHRNSCRQKRQSASHFSAEHSHKWEIEKQNAKRKWMQSFILKAFSGLPTQKIHLFDGFKPLCILLGGSVASRIPRGQFFPDFSRFFRASQSQMISKNQVGRMSHEPSDVRALEFIRFITVHIQNQMLFRNGPKAAENVRSWPLIAIQKPQNTWERSMRWLWLLSPLLNSRQ